MNDSILTSLSTCLSCLVRVVIDNESCKNATVIRVWPFFSPSFSFFLRAAIHVYMIEELLLIMTFFFLAG